ncbi:MAG: Gfo/Idh/MocA family oxidoreductase [Bryobacterales bacterium]|nr:Gfo/Idh/MocA family oxidoreductase [Bryobacterales bacterium]
MADRVDRRGFLGMSGTALAAATATTQPATAQRLTRPVRLGFVGVGDRGSYHLDIALGMDGIEVPAVCDINPAVLHRAKTWIEQAGKPPPRLYGKTRTDFERMCEQEDLDCIICSTSWKWHAPILLAAMRNGKNAVSEVPLIQTLDEAWEIVETHEQTGKWATLGFKGVHSTLTNMVHQGVLGDIIHAESGYVHDLRLVKFDPEREPWRLQHSVGRNGNLYPDHPTCRLMPVMDINHSDRFELLVSMSSKAVMLNRYADLFYGPDHPYATKEMKQGDYNCTLLRTVGGKLYTLNFDTNTPHPREFTRIQGTKGVLYYSRGIGQFIYVDGVSPDHQWEPAEKHMEEYRHPVEKEYTPRPREAIRGHGGGQRTTPLSWHRLFEALVEQRVTDFDVYDSVTSSVISPLSERSVANRSEPVEFPDFTKGKWKERLPVEVAYDRAQG